MPTSTSALDRTDTQALVDAVVSPTPLDPLLEAKLLVPRRHVGTLRRVRLLRQLGTAADLPVVSIVAPPGYGKSSLMAQWATFNSRPVAWLTVDDSDNNPVLFLTHLAAAIDRREALGPELFSAIASDTVSHLAVVGRLLAAMSRPRERIAIAIDDGQRIRSRACLDILAELIEHVPEGSQVAIAGRSQMRLPFARWRAQGSLLAIGPAELAMDEREALGLGRELGLRLPADTVKRLTSETEGWPALLALAMMGAQTDGEGSERAGAGAEHLIDDYLRSEILERRSAAEIQFLTRTSILAELPAGLCDAVADRHGSADVLSQLARSTLLVDDYGGSYRYHTLLRDFLQRELAQREPAGVATFHRRAASWYEENQAIERAVDHAFKAGDQDLVAALVGSGFIRYHWSGQRATIRAWARRVRVDALEARPWLAVLAAWEEIAAGDVGAAIRFADIAERGVFEGGPPDGTASFEAGRAMLRASMARHGADDALANAGRAVEAPGQPCRVARLRAVAAGLCPPHTRRSGRSGHGPG